MPPHFGRQKYCLCDNTHNGYIPTSKSPCSSSSSFISRFNLSPNSGCESASLHRERNWGIFQATILLFKSNAPACPVPRERPAWPCACSKLVHQPKPPELVVETSGSSLGRGHQSASSRGIKSQISLYWYCQKSLYSLNSKEHSEKQVRIIHITLMSASQGTGFNVQDMCASC